MDLMMPRTVARTGRADRQSGPAERGSVLTFQTHADLAMQQTILGKQLGLDGKRASLLLLHLCLGRVAQAQGRLLRLKDAGTTETETETSAR